jgi:hypothetical protein
MHVMRVASGTNDTRRGRWEKASGVAQRARRRAIGFERNGDRCYSRDVRAFDGYLAW